MISDYEAYIRYSWKFRFICVALPLIIHLRSSSMLDYVHGKFSSVVMEPDIASVIFVVSTSLALSRMLATAIPFYTDKQHQMTLKPETLLICLTMTLFVKTFLYFVKDVASFRPYYLKALAVSSSTKGFHFLRLVTALTVLHSVLLRLERHPQPIQRSLRLCNSSNCMFRKALIVTSCVMWLSKCTIFSNQYSQQLPLFVKVIVESLFNVAIIEAVHFLVWRAVEFHVSKGIDMIKTLNIYQDAGGDIVVETLLTIIAFATVYFSATGTGYWQTVKTLLYGIPSNEEASDTSLLPTSQKL
uniref:Uncharacterized protein n=1 Tax=Anopheles minimus TaxID=112268 RepID=A0A182WGY2_9DIPT